MIKNKFLSATLGAGLLVAATTASAAVITLGEEFSGASDPSGTPPWLQATFTDVVGGVQLTLASLLQDPAEFVDEWMFNLDPTLDPTALSIAYQSRTGSFGSNPVVSTGVNAFKADGDGFYDIRFVFDKAPPSDRFGNTDSVTYLISGITGLDAADFLFWDQGGSKGDFMSAAHIQGIAPDGQNSGWIGGDDGSLPPEQIPEPGMLFLMGAGLLGLGMARRRTTA